MKLTRDIATALVIVASLTVVRSDGYGQAELVEPYFKRGTIVLASTFPYVNTFSFLPVENGRISNTGFMGFGVDIDLYLSEDNYVSISGKFVADIFIPFPAAVRYAGEKNFLSSPFICLSNNNVVKEKFTMAYGAAFGWNSWSYMDFTSDTLVTPKPNMEKTYGVIGLYGSIKYQIGKRFYVAMNYRPTFLRLSNEPIWTYEHIASLEFGWRFRVKK